MLEFVEINTKFRLILWMLVTLLLQPQLASAAAPLNHFEVDSYKAIIEQHRGEAFLMVLWSMDCPPCFEELVTLGQFHQEYPDARIVLVSTDTLTSAEEINQLMQQHRLDDVQQWVFNNEATLALRYAIDPVWYGELPRSYFHRANHQRLAKSGKLDEIALLRWFNLKKD